MPGLSVECPQDVGQAVEVPASGAAADPLVGDLGEGQEFPDQRRDDGRARGSHELFLDPGRIDRDVLKEFGHGRGRDGEEAVGGPDEARAHVERRAEEGPDAERLGQPAGAQNVHQSVVGPGLMEMRGAEGAAVHSGFGLEQPLEDLPGVGLDAGREGAPSDRPFHVGPGPCHGLLAL